MEYIQLEDAQPYTPLMQAYTLHIGLEDEKNWEAIASAKPGSLMAASMLVAEACYGAAHDREDAAQEALVYARRLLDRDSLTIEESVDNLPARNSLQNTYRRAAGLAALTHVLADRFDLDSTEEYRLRDYRQTMQELIDNRSDLRVAYRNWQRSPKVDGEPPAVSTLMTYQSGWIAEQTSQLLLNRHHSPTSIAIAALPHHDYGQGRNRRLNNHDLVVVESHNRWDRHRAQQVQVKAGCLGYCEEYDSYDKATKDLTLTRLEDIRDKYSRDTLLVSGHCDLGMRYAWDKELELPVADLFAREAIGKDSTEDQHRLDTYARHLWQVLYQENPMRRGKQDTRFNPLWAATA